MPAILITLGILNHEAGDALDRYASAVIPLIEAAKGTVLFRATFREAVVGDGFPEFVAVIEFQDAAGIRELMAGDAYRAAIPDRTLAFRELKTFICDPL